MTANVIQPLSLFQKMKEEDLGPIIQNVCVEHGISQHQAEELLEAFLQWFSLIPSLTKGKALQMLASVDKIWHSMILHTKFYRTFCKKYIGYYVDHNPLDVKGNSLELKNEYANTTLTMLDESFGDQAHPELKNLKHSLTCCFFYKKGSKRKCGKRNTYVVKK